MTDFTNAAWDGSASRFKDTDAFCAACLVDDNPPGAEKKQSLCHLPIKEPNGNVNTNALGNAAARLLQTQTSAANKKKAARAIIRYRQEAKLDVSDALKKMAQ